MDLASILSHPAWTAVTGLLMVVATGLLVVATRKLAETARVQTALLERQQKHQVEIGYANIAGEDGNNRFGGVTLTNVGVPDVTIKAAYISKGIPAAAPKTTTEIHSYPDWTTEYQGRQISNFKPPHRLMSGDRIEVLYNLESLAIGLDPGQRVRHEFQDTFGNTYASNWIDYYEDPKSISHHMSPGDGLREPAYNPEETR